MKAAVNLVVALAAASLIVLPSAAWARQGAGHGRGGHGGGSHSGQGHNHRHLGYGAAFAGGALFFPWPYSYDFYPLPYGIQPPEPIVYIEQFTGTPTPETEDWIYCPGKAASYPEVTECTDGWQRVIPQGQATGQLPAP